MSSIIQQEIFIGLMMISLASSAKNQKAELARGRRKDKVD
jgi:hypothetical protein